MEQNYCFTLTMWDVKKDKMIKEKDTKKSFTLTMWDVKFNNTKEFFF